PAQAALLPRPGEVRQGGRRGGSDRRGRVRPGPHGEVDQHVHGEGDDQRDRDHRQLQAQGSLGIAVHEAALSLRARTAYWLDETIATMTVSTTASAMLYPNSPSVNASL